MNIIRAMAWAGGTKAVYFQCVIDTFPDNKTLREFWETDPVFRADSEHLFRAEGLGTGPIKFREPEISVSIDNKIWRRIGKDEFTVDEIGAFHGSRYSPDSFHAETI